MSPVNERRRLSLAGRIHKMIPENVSPTHTSQYMQHTFMAFHTPAKKKTGHTFAWKGGNKFMLTRFYHPKVVHIYFGLTHLEFRAFKYSTSSDTGTLYHMIDECKWIDKMHSSKWRSRHQCRSIVVHWFGIDIYGRNVSDLTKHNCNAAGCYETILQHVG